MREYIRRHKVSTALVFIVAIAFFLRVYKVSQVPPALSNDEIAVAYDAYSVLLTGKDRHNEYLPISFRSNEDYKAPLIHYLVAITVAIFGNNEFSVRLPSVFFGALTPLLLFLLVKRTGGDDKLALVSAFLLAVTPGLVFTSRTALSYDIGLFFLTGGVYLFFVGFGNRKLLYLSAIFLSLSAYAYHAEKVVAPILMVVLSIVYSQNLGIKKILQWWAVFVLFMLPIFLDIVFGAGETRASTEFLLNDLVLRNQLAGVANVFSQAYIVLSFWLDKYLGYQGLSYIFVHGMNASGDYGISDFGFLNLLQLPLFILGLIYVNVNS